MKILLVLRIVALLEIVWSFKYDLNVDNKIRFHPQNDIDKLLDETKESKYSKLISWDQAFDCKIRRLAYEYAQKLSAGTGTTTDLQYVFIGLDLNTTCKQDTFKHTSKDKDSNKIKKNRDSEVIVYVDEKVGLKTNGGSFDEPLPSIQLGIEKCKHLTSTGSCTVIIREGIYRLSKPITIDADNIKLVSHPNENVEVTSNVVVKPQWKASRNDIEVYENLNPLFEDIKPKQSNNSVIYAGVVANASKCQELCTVTYSKSNPHCSAYVYFNESNKEFANQCYIRNDGIWNTKSTIGAHSGKRILIYSADLRTEGLDKVDQVFVGGRRAVRARFPNANPETQGLHTIPTGYVDNADSWIGPRSFPAAAEIEIGAPTRTATLFPGFSLGIGGSVEQFDPPQSYWATKNPFGGGGSTYRVPSGLTYSKDLEINQREWKNASTGIVHAFQNLHWGNWIYQLDSRNKTTQTLKWTWGGFQEARGSTAGKEWYVENIFEELDVRNEWFYDENTKILYYYPGASDGSLPVEISIPTLSSLVRVVGTKNEPRRNISISGITLKGTTLTFLEKYMVPSGGDWTVHRNGMVYVEGTENFVMEGCTLDSPGGNGVFLYKYNRGATIAHNTMYRLGDNGIVLVGDAILIDGSRGEQPRGTQVLYNIVFQNGLWGKQTYPFVQSVSCETHLEGNIFFDGPRAGMNFNDGFGGGNVVLNNILFDFVRETDDHGPINTWDRVPYLTDVVDGKTLSLDVKQNEIHRNFIINNFRSVWPIDHDDGTCFWNDTYNFLVYGGFKNYLGHNKISQHNIYVYPDRHPSSEAFNKMYCADTTGQTLGTSGYGDFYKHNKCVFGTTTFVYSLGNCEAEHSSLLTPYFAYNQLYTPKKWYAINCGGQHWNFDQAQEMGFDVGSTLNDLPEDDEIIQWGKDLLGL